MKKIIAIILGVLVLAAGLIGCTSCKPEEKPDPHEGLYGVYKLVPLKEVDSGIEVRDGKNMANVEALPSNRVVSRFPEHGSEINDFLIDLRAAIGDTITITKDKVVFSEGEKVTKEFECDISYGWVDFERTYDFPLYSFRYTVFNERTSPVYQLEIEEPMWFSPEPDEGPWKSDYTAYFYYLK